MLWNKSDGVTYLKIERRKKNLLQHEEPLTTRPHEGKNLDLIVRCPWTLKSLPLELSHNSVFSKVKLY